MAEEFNKNFVGLNVGTSSDILSASSRFGVNGAVNNTKGPFISDSNRTPFDIRLRRMLSITSMQFKDGKMSGDATFHAYSQMPMTYIDTESEYSYNIDAITNSYTRNSDDINALEKTYDEEAEKVKQELDQAVSSLAKNPVYNATASIMNPYAFNRLYGSSGGKYLVDTRNKRKYYEIDGDEEGHYAKNPTTSNIIKWGAQDPWGRRVYSYQDFAFCKEWNVIPNNRLITLRRFTQPTYDNLNFPGMDDNTTTVHPVATALTYFGEDTENKLSDLISFTAKYNWKSDEKGDVWNATGNAPDMSQLENGVGWNKFFSAGIVNMSTVLGLVGKSTPNGNENFDFRAAQGLPPDPYTDGPYTNRILGPLNAINKTYKRERGLEFTNEIKLTFKYVSRPIGGINNKAVLLDLLANILVMAYGSGVWWGGSHRFMITPVKYPFTNNDCLQKLWKGRLIGEDGAARSLVTTFQEKLKTGMGGDSVGNIFGTLGDAFKSILGDMFGAMGLPSVDNLISGNVAENSPGRNLATNAEQQVAASIQSKAGALPYLHGMRSILTGEPVGDWHLVIGNPLNPIAEIGNLVCTNLQITFDEELGPDDFPLGFKAVISLDHGIPRDRDGIEAMFNKGAGRIYELPDKYSSSADGQTAVDSATRTKGYGAFSAGPQNPIISGGSRWGTSGTTDNTKGPFRDAYKTLGTPSYIPSTVNINNVLYNTGMNEVYHKIMPWQTKVIL